MHVFHSAHKLEEDLGTVYLGAKAAIGAEFQLLLQALPLNIFHDQIQLKVILKYKKSYLSLSVYGIVKSHDILMLHPLKQFDLFNNTSLALLISELVLIVDLHSHIVPGLPMLCLLHHCVGALTQNFPESVVSYLSVV